MAQRLHPRHWSNCSQCKASPHNLFHWSAARSSKRHLFLLLNYIKKSLIIRKKPLESEFMLRQVQARQSKCKTQVESPIASSKTEGTKTQVMWMSTNTQLVRKAQSAILQKFASLFSVVVELVLTRYSRWARMAPANQTNLPTLSSSAS